MSNALEEVGRVFGEGAWQEHAPFSFEGVAPHFTAVPRNEEALARGLACAAGHGLGALVRGGGTHLYLGNLPTRADFVLSTRGLLGIEELDTEDAVVKVRAGTPLTVVGDAAETEGLELAFDPAGEKATIGGVLASGRNGPRALGRGPVRDQLLGLEVALATGERTRCGGRVVKNVTGYDLGKLHTGAFGTTGVLTSAWLRLRARPERLELWWADAPAGEAGVARALECARRATTRACAVATGSFADAITGRATPVTLLELAGDNASVARDANWLRDELGAESTPEGERVMARWRERQGAAAPFAGKHAAPVGGEAPREGAPLLRARIGALPSRMPAALKALERNATGLLLQPGLGLLYAELPCGGGAGDSPALTRSLAALEAAVTAARGTLLLESLPAAAKVGRDVFGLAGASRTLTQRIAFEFDPTGLLNPGRVGLVEEARP